MDNKKTKKGGAFDDINKITKKERKVTKRCVEYHFENLENMLELLTEGSYVFYNSRGMVAESSIGSVDFKHQFESENGTLILYISKFRKTLETKNLCGDDVIIKYMEKYPKINFIPGTLTIK